MPATTALVERELRRQHFAVLSTAARDGSPHAAGVTYGAVREASGLVLYVMTRRHLRKAQDIATNPAVSLVIPVPRRILWFVPPGTMQLRGTAEILEWTDVRGTAVFARFWLGRRILAAYRASYGRGERRICFVRITPEPVVRSYMVGSTLLQISRRIERGAGRVTLPGN